MNERESNPNPSVLVEAMICDVPANFSQIYRFHSISEEQSGQYGRIDA